MRSPTATSSSPFASFSSSISIVASPLPPTSTKATSGPMATIVPSSVWPFSKRFEKGQTLEGTIVAIGPEVAFVDVGGKGEATIEIDELKDANGELDVAVGDRIQAMVVSTEEGLIDRKSVV